jgi:hypothetical protein
MPVDPSEKQNVPLSLERAGRLPPCPPSRPSWYPRHFTGTVGSTITPHIQVEGPQEISLECSSEVAPKVVWKVEASSDLCTLSPC